MDVILQITAKIMIYLVATKAIIEYHFPWEKCNCCGEKYKNHIPIKERQIGFKLREKQDV